jgi:hypothetical protein
MTFVLLVAVNGQYPIIIFLGFRSLFATLALPLLQAVAFSRHINEVVHPGNGDLDDVLKVFAGGTVAGSQGSFGQVPNK